MDRVRIFISSPGDVELERQIARGVIHRLQREFVGGPAMEPYFWEYEPMRLTRDYTDQIPSTSGFDIVVCILWSRLGTPLGPSHRRADGSLYQSGTEFEVEDAVASFEKRGAPDLLVYRNRNDPPIKARPKEERERQLEQFDALEAFLERWTRDGEIIKGALTSYTDIAQFEELLTEHLRKLIATRLPADAGPAHAAQCPSWTQGSPFRGLQPFEFEHAPVFRGRTRAVQDVIALARQQHDASREAPVIRGEKAPPNFVLVSAMSGIGKSSLIRAGVLPLLTVPGVIEGVGLWRRAVMRPGGGDFFDNLVDALTAPEALPELLADGTAAATLAQRLRDNPAAGDLLVKGALSQAASRLQAEEKAELRQWEAEFAAQGRTGDVERLRQQRDALRQREAVLVLFVDQLEEIFAAEDRDAAARRDAFLQAVDTLARSGRMIVLATLRSDFLPRAVEVHLIASLIKEGSLYQLEPPNASELAQIIRDPAREAGLSFEEHAETGARLDDVLLAATHDDPAALPLLEFTLDRLYENRAPDGRLTFAAYEAINRVEGALAQSAEAAFAALSPGAQGAFARVFGALVKLSDLRQEERPVRRNAVAAELEAYPGAAELAARFAESRLLVLDQDPSGGATVAVVHEALFSHWDRLRDWIEENRHLLRVRGRVEQAAARWQTEGRPRDLLFPDGRFLAEAEELLRHRNELPLDGPIEAFVMTSAALHRSRRRRRVAALMVLAAGLAAAAIVSLYQYRSYQQNRIEAKLLEYKQAADAAEKRFLSHGPAESGIREALDASQKVLTTIEEVKALQGAPPEKWVDAAAKAHEFSGVLRAELGDTEGSLREFEARKALPTEAKGLGEVLGRNPVLISYAMVVFDLKLDLTIANHHLKLLLKQNEVLKEALAERMQADKSAPAASAEAPRPPSGAKPGSAGTYAHDQALETLRTFEGLVRVLDYMSREYRRNQDFEWLLSAQKQLAPAKDKLEGWETAERIWADRLSTGARWLEQARKELTVDWDKAAATRLAAQRLSEAQFDYADFLLTHKQYERAFAAAREGLWRTLDAEPELKAGLRLYAIRTKNIGQISESFDPEAQRFGFRKIAASALVSLGKGEEAFVEVQTGTGRMLEYAHSSLYNSVSKTLRAHRDVAKYWSAVGKQSQAVEVARQAVDGLLRQKDSPFEGVDGSLLYSAHLSLSWFELADRQFAEAEKTAVQGLAVVSDDLERANLNTNLAHALLFQGKVEQARGIYEAWKTKPVAEKPKDKEAKLFAAAILEDFEEFERLGILKGVAEAQAIAEAMKATVAEAKQRKSEAAPAQAQ